MSSNNNKLKILLIDDEKVSFDSIDFILGNVFVLVHEREFREAQTQLEKDTFDLILLDLDLENTGSEGFKKGLKNIKTLKSDYPNLPVIILTNDRNQDTAINAMEYGADYFFWKRDLKPDKCIKKIKQLTENNYLAKKLEQIERQKIYLEKKLHKVEQAKAHPFIGNSPQIQSIKEDLEVAAFEFPNSTILLTGETGVGKEVAAHYFYAHSRRNKHEFVPTNLSSISQGLFESTLFGHVEGAFTGAISDREGYFQQANKGILFLDEIGEINVELQRKLLRVLQDKKVRRVGENKLAELDIQIITATNSDLDKAIKEGRIREDFYHRISDIIIHIPPLRERKEDIMPLIAHFLKVPLKLVEKNFCSKEAKDKLLNYSWKGNVRELQKAVKKMEFQRIKKKKDSFDIDCLPLEILNYQPIEGIKEITSNISNVSVEERKVLVELQAIEELAISCNNRKGDVAEAYNTNTDGLRYLVKTHHNNYPQLFEKGFEHIKTMYKLN